MVCELPLLSAAASRPAIEPVPPQRLAQSVARDSSAPSWRGRRPSDRKPGRAPSRMPQTVAYAPMRAISLRTSSTSGGV
jgi:hypothetical protein